MTHQLLWAALTTHGDPLNDKGVWWFVWVVDIIKVLVAFGVLLVSVMLMIWFERKVISDMQSRIGPNRAGPWGLLQTLADGTKLFFKEDLTPLNADRAVFKLAPYLSLVPARADPGLAREVAVLTANLATAETPGAEALLAGGTVTDVRLETI